MNESKTPKIVVGVVIAAVYAGGLGYFLLRDKPAANVASNEAPAPAAGITDAYVPEPTVDANAADLSIGATEEGADLALSSGVAEPVAANETAVAAQPAVVAQPAVAERSRVPEPEPQQSPPAADVASSEFEPSTDDAAPAQPAVASVATANDSQITAEVKTQIAAVAPASTIEVTTTDGMVELSGSVPSREEMEKVSLAAKAVPNVRSVDASALMVSN